MPALNLKPAEPVPPFLYHGTAERHLERILRDGLKGRGEHGRSNFKRTIESNPGTVYLTDAYPLFFAVNAARKGERLVVIQMATEAVDDGHLVPDEDVLEQSGRGHDGVPGSMNKRTRHYRKGLRDFLYRDNWKVSLRAMGTCGYMGTIAPGKFARIALLDIAKAPTVALAGSDAMICLANYRFCGPKYRNLTNRLFGLPTEDDSLEGTIDPALADNPDLPEEIRALALHRRAYAERLAEELAAGLEVRDL